ncbi:MAG: sialate O-acetylesterase [Planctomycetota bacterium]|jgi:sialate O-acetylesterase
MQASHLPSMSETAREWKPRIRRWHWIIVSLMCLGSVSSRALAQMPKADVVEVPAIQDGLCVSNLFQSNMVLQRNKPIGVWGWATPGQEVSVKFGGEEQTVITNADRRWRISLAAMPASDSPRSMTVRSATEALTLENILVGDVWVLGGQSNMEFELAKVENGALEIASAHYPEIRILTVPYGEGLAVRESFPRLHQWSSWFGRHFRKGDWDVCTPEIARELSAIGYAFARRVHKASGVPIGVIDASRGGTTVETWTPISVLQQMDSAAVRAKLAEWDEKVAAWDPRADLERRIARHRQKLAKMKEQGKTINDAERAEPSDLQPGPIADHNLPGSCFAAMLGPLASLPVKGVIFHQGYNNALDGKRGVQLYRKLLPVMIRSWRAAFANPQLPFGILSQCTDGYPQTRDNYLEMMLNPGIHIRAAHYETFLDLHAAGDQNIGFASTYDLRRRWYHPQVKVPAGERIARWALATQYGFGNKLPWKPPALLGMETRDAALILRLDSEVSDPQDGAIVGFAIAGTDRKFQPADVAYLQIGEDDRGRPRFDRKQLLLTSPLVSAPIHFRYAWARNPLANLQVTGNKDLPFATQRSDEWDMGSVPLGVLDSEIEEKLSRAQRNQVLQVLRKEDLRRRLAEARALLEANGEAAGAGEKARKK